MNLLALFTIAWTGKSNKNITREMSRRSPFWLFIFSSKQNRHYLAIASIGTIIQFVGFKILYPYPDFISDSYSYIATNLYHMDVNLWPIGYSKFLLLLHSISHSDILVVAIQYLALQLSLIYFFYTLIYLYRPARRTTIILYISLIFNPLILYLSNSILSDALFVSLSIVFFIQFLWMLHNPTFYQVLIQGLIIGIAFTLRYTAIYYPLVALAGLLLSKHPKAFKVWGFLLGIAFIVPFYLYTQTKTKEQTGTAEFSVFGGWQLANNALYMYDHINVDTNRLPPETKSLDRMSRQFWQKVHPSWQELSALPGTYFIKVPYAILKPYMAENSPSYYDPVGQFKAWGKVSPIYKQYGSYLISHHPIQFLRYYLLLNTKNYFLPHLEKFDCYNLEINTVPPIVQDWFDFITPEVNSVSPTLPAKIFYIFPLVFLVLNVYFAGFILWVLSKKRYEQLNPLFRSSLLFATIFLLVNFGFSVFATPVVLRYEIIPMIILISFLLLLLELPTKINQLKPLKTTNA